MATGTVVCPECATPMPYGRQVCPACGARLASVAGAEPAAGAEEQEAAWGAVPSSPAPEPPAPAAPSWPVPPAFPAVLHESTGPRWPNELDNGMSRVAGEPSVPQWPTTSAAHAQPYVQAQPYVRAQPDVPAEPYTPAGAYMPPSATFAPDPAAVADPKPRPGVAPLFADLPFDLPDDMPGWFVASGAGVAAVGFFLPWAHRLIGASGEGYFDAWGLGSLTHLPVFAAVLATLGLAVLPNRVPAWLRAGILPLALGGLLIGLAWPYVFVGPLRGQLGSLLEAVAGLTLVTGGILALRAGRHAGSPPPV